MPTRLADPELEQRLAAQPEYSEPVLAQLRDERAARFASRPPGPDVARVRDLGADGVPVRVYVPVSEPSALLVHLHGGGWTIGPLDGHDTLCRRLAHRADVRVLSVDYRLAPEHPWPASVDDASGSPIATAGETRR